MFHSIGLYMCLHVCLFACSFFVQGLSLFVSNQGGIYGHPCISGPYIFFFNSKSSLLLDNINVMSSKL